jgi:hypothetical protein
LDRRRFGSKHTSLALSVKLKGRKSCAIDAIVSVVKTKRAVAQVFFPFVRASYWIDSIHSVDTSYFQNYEF